MHLANNAKSITTRSNGTRAVEKSLHNPEKSDNLSD